MAFKYEVLQRLKFIECLAMWHGELNTNLLCAYFGIKRQQASRDISLYLNEVAPNNLLYDGSRKRYLPTSTFEPRLGESNIEEYLSLITNVSDIPQIVELTKHFELRGRMEPVSDTNLFRTLVLACKNKQVLEVDHRTLEAPLKNPSSFAPHTLIATQFDWLVRGYNLSKEKYDTFAIKNIFAAYPIDDNAELSAIGSKNKDDDWNTEVNIFVVPDPRLSPVQKLVIEKQFNMEFGSLLLTSRVCFLKDTISELGIDINFKHPDPIIQKVVIENLSGIQRWLI